MKALRIFLKTFVNDKSKQYQMKENSLSLICVHHVLSLSTYDSSTCAEDNPFLPFLLKKSQIKRCIQTLVKYHTSINSTCRLSFFPHTKPN